MYLQTLISDRGDVDRV